MQDEAEIFSSQERMIKFTRKSLANKLGIGIETLRYYENIQLIPTPARTGNGYRVYNEDDAARIKHILIAKKYGFSLREIKKLFDMAEKSDFKRNDIKPFLKKKVMEIDNQIDELGNLKSLLLKIIKTY